jgi:acyl carrier protein
MTVTIDEIRQLVGLQLGQDEVRPEDELQADLGAESADVANLVAVLEDRYGVEIDEEELPDLVTVADLYRRVAGG